MIDELHVTNLALIEDVTVEPAPGLTALTGETGAGKSALLSAIRLLVGDRATGDQVRDGSEGLCVEGRVCFDGEAESCPDGHVVCRRVSSEGRSRCSIDGSMATVAQLAQFVGSKVDLCGQHDHQRLLSVSSHLPLLDSWTGEEASQALAAYDEAWGARARAAEELERVTKARGESEARVADARFAVSRIGEVNPARGEYEELEALLPRLEHAESIIEGANAAHEALSGDGGALDSLNSAISALDAVSGFDAALRTAADALRGALYPLEDAARDVRRYRDDAEFDPADLQRADARMGALVGLMRSFGPRMEDVFSRFEEAQRLIALVDDSEEAERRARAGLDEAERRLVDAASRLTSVRTAAAPRFAACVTGQMARLEMGGAQLVVDVSPLERPQWGRGGADRVEFLYRPGPGLALRSFVKIASGGEVSRVMLAIKVALGEHDDVETLIFDEIDAGVGGSTARAVASVLADLARTHQVVVVTHLAQVAVAAERQYVVSKRAEGSDGRPETRLAEARGEERVREIARMLSGDESETSLGHARELLERGVSVAG